MFERHQSLRQYLYTKQIKEVLNCNDRHLEKEMAAMQQSTDRALFACCPPVVAMPAGEVILPTPQPIIAFHWQSCLSETQPLSPMLTSCAGQHQNSH